MQAVSGVLFQWMPYHIWSVLHINVDTEYSVWGMDRFLSLFEMVETYSRSILIA